MSEQGNRGDGNTSSHTDTLDDQERLRANRLLSAALQKLATLLQCSDSPTSSIRAAKVYTSEVILLKFRRARTHACTLARTHTKVIDVPLLPTTKAFHYTRLDSQCTESKSTHLFVL